MKIAVAITMASSFAASAVAAPVLPHVATLSFAPAAPAAGARMNAGARVGTAHARGASNLAPVLIGVGILAVAGGIAGIAAATSGHGGNGGQSVSP